MPLIEKNFRPSLCWLASKPIATRLVSLVRIAAFLAIVAVHASAPAQETEQSKSGEKAKSSPTPPAQTESTKRTTDGQSETDAKKPQDASKKEKAKEKDDGWRKLLPAKGLGKWEVTDFGGEGKVTWNGKQLHLGIGQPMTGLHNPNDILPPEDYELSLRAQRVKGGDFFCCLTFPVGKQRCSFVAGGWGGSVTGISSVNGADASENETSSYSDFENGKWYRIKVQVTKESVKVWIDDEESVDLSRKYADLDTRIEVYGQEPLGVCTFMTEALIEDFKWRPIGKAKPKATGVKDKKAAPSDAPKKPAVESESATKSIKDPASCVQ
ncbi:MAG TPA: hypothetical protein DDW52_24950 [Planctomycetaceae bacterium]|nr:hypothetical protein [Planctomycetaceae bacterium]